MNNKKRIVYLEGRPSAHKLHRRFAQSLNVIIDFIDAKVRWQDLDKSLISKILSWFINARYLSKKYREYDVFLIDNLHYTPIIMKIFFKNKKRMIVHLGSHTLYFMKIGYFSNINNAIHKWALTKYDGLIFEGKMAYDMASSMINNMPPYKITFLGPPKERMHELLSVKYNVHSNKILIIANGPTSFRSFYKGMDIMCSAFDEFNNRNNNCYELIILGDWTEDNVKREILRNIKNTNSISFKGKTEDITKYIEDSCFSIHCTRGDAFPTSTIEIMTAGIPVIISEWTGTKEIVEKVDPCFISKLEIEDIVLKMDWFISLSEEQRINYSNNFRKVAEKFTEENAIEYYKEAFNELTKEMYIKKQ